jgi:hypothetical protein
LLLYGFIWLDANLSLYLLDQIKKIYQHQHSRTFLL